MSSTLLSWIQVLGIPFLIASVILWWLGRAFRRRDAEEKERETVREKNNILLIRSVGASIALGEATAHAIQRGYANGDMEAALEYAQQVKHEQKDFLTEQAQKSIV